jgi:hypothetical protein
MPSELLAGVFATEAEIVAAAGAARRDGLSIHDAYVPYPVHGLDSAMGLAPSALPTVCFRFAATGLIFALGFEYWCSLFNWPMNVGGKSYSASPALLPVAFELTVLFASLGTVATFFYIRRLSPVKKPTLPHLGGLDDRFVLALSVEPGADVAALESFLRKQGAMKVESRRSE